MSGQHGQALLAGRLRGQAVLDLSEATAAELLRRWAWYGHLTWRESLAVLARFPAGGAR
jgi:hypothetical protein